MNKEKNDELKLSVEDTKLFEQLENELSVTRGSKAAEAGIGDLCQQYRKIEPILKKVLPIIRLIPKFGKTVADAIEFLMQIANMACPVQ